jgi:hypothetical protein
MPAFTHSAQRADSAATAGLGIMKGVDDTELAKAEVNDLLGADERDAAVTPFQKLLGVPDL